MSVSVTEKISAPAGQVWDMVADLTRMHEWSPENAGCTWTGGAHAPVPGARFRGTNRRGKRRWSTTGTVVEADRDHRFAFDITAGGLKIARWTFELEATEAGCRITETWIDRRGRLAKALGRLVTGVTDRAAHNRVGMTQTLERLKAAAEQGAT